MNEIENDRVARMANPPHPGGIVLDCIREEKMSVTDTAIRLGVSRACLNRILREESRIRPNHALALERLGWLNAEMWLRLQASYDLALERRKAA